MPELQTIIHNAHKLGLAVPAFNVPYLPMIAPVVQAVVEADSFALVETARVEWLKFGSRSPGAVAEAFFRCHNPDHTGLHLDHIPATEEDGRRVDTLSILQDAIDLGYHSVMIDGSLLPLEENIAATKEAVDLAHTAGIPCEAELGVILNYDHKSLPPYERFFESKLGFTDMGEAHTFVSETGCDWLSVSIGNLHGSITEIVRDKKKINARLDLEHLATLSQGLEIPLVLHGGSGIPRKYVLKAFKKGIAKINIGTEIRQVYETALKTSGSIAHAQESVFQRTFETITNTLELGGTQPLLTQERL